ncbi:MAG: hypothetical protein ACJ77Z_21220 [Thermoleophilaceae bacterium]|jgi:hypothetical protein
MRSKYGWQRWMATAAVVSALAAPGASASPADGLGTSPALKAYEAATASQGTASRNAGGDFRSPDARVAFESGPVSTSPVAQVSSGGFQWSDAGIGAVAMLGAISLCGALFLLSGRRRDRHLPRAIG